MPTASAETPSRFALAASAAAPLASDTTAVRAAYDAVASGYDARVAPSSWVRERLWERLDALFPPGARVLDVTAGTGLDVRHLVARGVQVTACDLSPAMLRELRDKCPGVPTHVADFNRLDEIEELTHAAPFDGLIATFAGLNAARDLRPFAASAARLLRPGGVLYVHVLNRWPLGDLARSLRRGPAAFGRALAASLSGVRQARFGGLSVPHHLFSPRRLYRRAFAPAFELRGLAGQGIVRPADAPPGTDRAARARWELWAAERPLLRACGTFFTLELVRRSQERP
ncbi:MAG TPA: class I SAM-dependent methyltransferase [Thermoanaerobaculia bacterium]